jgi:hypothetical protein
VLLGVTLKKMVICDGNLKECDIAHMYSFMRTFIYGNDAIGRSPALVERTF